MRTVTLIPGDGIGPEIAVAVQKIFAAAEVPFFILFGAHFVQHIILMLALARHSHHIWTPNMILLFRLQLPGTRWMSALSGTQMGRWEFLRSTFYFVIKDIISPVHYVWHQGTFAPFFDSMTFSNIFSRVVIPTSCFYVLFFSNMHFPH